MPTTHIYFNGNCKEAIELYKRALGATVESLYEDADSHLVIHAEIAIDGEVLMLNDFAEQDGPSTSGGYQLCVNFESEEALKAAYAAMEAGSTTIRAMAPTEYSPCTVRFIDAFDVRWAFMV